MKSTAQIFFILLTFALTISCGDNGNNNQQPVAPYGTASCQGSCTDPSLVQTSAGCLPQGTCGACSGSYNGTCIQSSMTGGYQGAPGQYPAGPNPSFGSTYPYNNYSPGYSPGQYFYPGRRWNYYYYYGN